MKIKLKKNKNTGKLFFKAKKASKEAKEMAKGDKDDKGQQC